jgi:hypothetical protein
MGFIRQDLHAIDTGELAALPKPADIPLTAWTVSEERRIR